MFVFNTVSRQVVVSHEAKKQYMCTSFQTYATTTVVIYTDGRSKFLKYCNSATITAIAWFITDLALLT